MFTITRATRGVSAEQTKRKNWKIETRPFSKEFFDIEKKYNKYLKDSDMDDNKSESDFSDSVYVPPFPILDRFDVPSPRERSPIKNKYLDMTITEYAHKHRDMSETSERDLEVLFLALQRRCPETWNEALKFKAKDIFQKMELLLSDNVVPYLDPQKTVKRGGDVLDAFKFTAKDLIVDPKLWNMEEKEGALQFREVLRHFANCSPFYGRPFIKVWFEALVPCFSRWLLMSDNVDECVVLTLKHFLGAFGQPGIVVCLSDKGSSILEILKNCARSVEAVARGDVERYYWRRLVESCCGGEEEWQQLANIKNQDLELSQLDSLPPNWLLDTGDWAHMFANVVSPKVSKIFERNIKKIVTDTNSSTVVRMGPPKTLARIMAKSQRYQSESHLRDSSRWSRFGHNFRDQFKRPPTKPEDFLWNIMDFARCSIVVESARNLLEVKQLIEKQFPVVGLKNSYSLEYQVKGSGYRDLKLLVPVEFDKMELSDHCQFKENIVLICEVQLICNKWLCNKKTTSLSYKVLRATCLRDLLRDFAKYLGENCEDQFDSKISARNVLKYGWKNLVGFTDFSSITDENWTLIESCTSGWDPTGVEILITDLKASPDAVAVLDNKEEVNAACHAAYWGNHEILGTLIELKSNIGLRTSETNSDWHFLPLKYAIWNNKEECVRVLLNAGSILSKRNLHEITFEFGCRQNYERVMQLVRGEYVPPTKSEPKKVKSMITSDEVIAEARKGLFANFLDTHDVRFPVVCEILSNPVITNQLELCLQALWFGADVNFFQNWGTPLSSAILNGTPAVVKLLLHMKANPKVKINRRSIPTAIVRPMEEIVKALCTAGVYPDVYPSLDDTWYSVFHLIRICSTVKEWTNTRSKLGFDLTRNHHKCMTVGF